MRLGYTELDISMLARIDEVDGMSVNRRISVIPLNFRVFCATLCLFLIAGCHGGAKKYVLEGSVMRKNPSNQQISISHGDIPGFMPAMTMDYKVRDLGAFREVEPGDRQPMSRFAKPFRKGKESCLLLGKC
jgi:hypothetical protein